MKLSTIFVLVFPGTCAGGTNSEPFRYGGVEFTTNWFAKNPQWRASRGVVYNINAAKDWKWKTGAVLDNSNGVALVERRWTEDVYRVVPRQPGDPARYGNFLGQNPNAAPLTEKVGVQEKTERFLLTNAPAYFVSGWKVEVWATYLASDSFRGESLPLFDFGTTPTQSEVNTLRAKFQAIADRGRMLKEKR